MKSYSTRDVARLLGLSEPHVRSQARAGFLSPDRGPRNGYRFSFQDLVLLRTARELAQASVSARRIRRALQGLARQLPSGHSLSELRIIADGNRVLARDEEGAWNPESGQLQIDFTTGAEGGGAIGVLRTLFCSTPIAEAELGASDWFDLAVSLEVSEPAKARDAYLRALALEPDLAEAHVNLGRLLQLGGQIHEAAAHYRCLLERGRFDPIAAFNLGTALEELGDRHEAIAAYRRAIRHDNAFADAHFNLARLYEQLGRRSAAIRHWRAYQLLKEPGVRC
jgi:tetratricopeptide (TPR) repeat protein